MGELPQVITAKEMEDNPEQYDGVLVIAIEDPKTEPSTFRVTNDRLFKLSFVDEHDGEVYLFPDEEEFLIL